MLFTKSAFAALVGVVVAVNAQSPSPSTPPGYGGPSSSGKSISDNYTTPPGGSLTFPSVTGTPRATSDSSSASKITTGTSSIGVTISNSPTNSASISKTDQATGTPTGFPTQPKASTAKVNTTLATGQPSPSATLAPSGNGTNHTARPTPTPMPTSLGTTFTPYGAAFLVCLVGVVAMGF